MFLKKHSGPKKKLENEDDVVQNTVVRRKKWKTKTTFGKKYSCPQKKWKTKMTFGKNTVVRRNIVLIFHFFLRITVTFNKCRLRFPFFSSTDNCIFNKCRLCFPIFFCEPLLKKCRLRYPLFSDHCIFNKYRLRFLWTAVFLTNVVFISTFCGLLYFMSCSFSLFSADHCSF